MSYQPSAFTGRGLFLRLATVLESELDLGFIIITIGSISKQTFNDGQAAFLDFSGNKRGIRNS